MKKTTFLYGILFFTLLAAVTTKNKLQLKKKNKKITKEKFTSLKNLYGETLQPCRINSTDQNGSWDEYGLCSELHGGVHQICFKVNQKSKNFAKDTKQGYNWTLERLNKNHCMCLGAWSLYKARQNKNEISKTNNELLCESIPEISLSNNYVSSWNTWNGNELPNQIVNGVNSMVSQCLQKASKTNQKKYLKNKYLDLVKNKKEFHNSDLYLQLKN